MFSDNIDRGSIFHVVLRQYRPWFHSPCCFQTIWTVVTFTLLFSDSVDRGYVYAVFRQYRSWQQFPMLFFRQHRQRKGRRRWWWPHQYWHEEGDSPWPRNGQRRENGVGDPHVLQGYRREYDIRKDRELASWSRKISKLRDCVFNIHSALKLGKRLGSNAAGVFVKFQSELNGTAPNTNEDLGMKRQFGY